jgi:hypothetical protein
VKQAAVERRRLRRRAHIFVTIVAVTAVIAAELS